VNAAADIVIDVHGLTKKFNGRAVVRGLSLQVKRGTIYGFLGPNGSGKTTTIRMLCGLLTPDEGTGTCLGYDIRTEIVGTRGTLFIGSLRQTALTVMTAILLSRNVSLTLAAFTVAPFMIWSNWRFGLTIYHRALESK